MEKRHIIICAIAVLYIGVGIWLLIRPDALAEINHTYSEPETSVSNVSFSGEAEEKVKISFSSNIENGELDVIIYDSKGNVVKELDRAKRLETFLTLEYTDTYTVEAEYTDFIGSCKIAIYEMD